MPATRPVSRQYRPNPQRPASPKPDILKKPGADRSPAPLAKPDKPEHKILFQTFFKSVGPRTYASQIKEASNGNHYLVLTEGKRDEKTGEVRKTRLFVFSEDFVPFFRMLHETAQFIKTNPMSEEMKKKRDRHWQKKTEKARSRDRN